MSSYSANSVHAENGSSTTTCTYPTSVPPLGMHAHRSPIGSPSYGSETGRIVLHGNGRAGSEVRNVPFSNRSRMSVTPNDGFSRSFGAAGEALSLADGIHPLSGTKRVVDVPSSASSDLDVKSANGPNMRMSYTLPAGSTGSMEAAAQQYGLSRGPLHAHQEHQRRHGTEESPPPPPPLMLPTSSSPSSSVNDDSETKDMSHQTIHKCESCSKVYRHPSCLIKHRWEHTMYWKEASKFLMSKHQQVQLLEAAAILVGMDSNARSLPEEKALWPAAVSPPSSGLLGCEHFNFDTLMASKARNAAMQNDPAAAARMPYGTSAPPGPSVADMTMRARSMDGLHAPSKKPMYHPPTPVAVDEPAEEGDESGELNPVSYTHLTLPTKA